MLQLVIIIKVVVMVIQVGHLLAIMESSKEQQDLGLREVHIKPHQVVILRVRILVETMVAPTIGQMVVS